MEYTDAVRIGKELATREGSICWEVGDLLNELAPMGKRGANVGSFNIIKQWMEDVGSPWTFETLRNYRSICSKWPKDKRAKVGWSVHLVLATNPDRFDLIRDDMTLDEAKKLAGYKFDVGNRAQPQQLLNASNSYLRTALKRLAENGYKESELERFGELLEEAAELQDQLADALGMVIA